MWTVHGLGLSNMVAVTFLAPCHHFGWTARSVCSSNLNFLQDNHCLCFFFGRGGSNSPQWARTSSFTRFLDHTQRRTTVGRTPPDEWSARRRDLYLTTHNTHKRQISMPPVGFEPTISAGERPQSYALGIMILNNVGHHNCFITQGSYIGYMFRLIDQSSSGLFSRLSHKVLCTHWDRNVYTAPCDLTC